MSITIKSNPDGVSGAIQVNGNDAVVFGTQGITQGTPLSFRNKIINGKMEIAQRGTSFPAIAALTYTLDRYFVAFGGAAVATVSQQTDVPSSNEFQNSLRVSITTADASIAASDFGVLSQHIEGYNVRDLIGRDFTLSFRVRSSKTGIHCVAVRNSVNDRSYVMEYTVNAANTWETKTVTVPGGLITAGTWNWTNGVGLNVNWVLAAGTTRQTTAGAWQTGDFIATANQVNCLDTVGNIFAITGVQLEAGSIATPFEHRPYGTELALCQRYYEIGRYGQAGYSSWGTTFNRPFVVGKRATPTMTISNIDYAGLGAIGANAIAYSTREFQGGADWTGTAAYRSVGFDWQAFAEL